MAIKKLLFILIISMAILSACSGETTEEKIHNHLEEAVSLEEGFESQQSEITKLEKEEQKLYSQIIDLGMDDFDKIKELSSQAIEIIDERAEKIAKEKESIDASQEEFNKTQDLIENLEDPDVKDKAEKMDEIMDNRYEAYNTLHTAYTKSLELEKELYTMLQSEELEQEELTAQIDTINESYQHVLEANEQFNENTVEYNALKEEFYKLAEIDVTYEENPSADSSEGK
ncbi:YkyA family protein [Virgibacillus profundi]|uniref:YkyA family protein n=1 Tax=Virgibacillus profundi TaxID=2024555 RepID=UPI001F0A35AD|nr:YkyA family protein [Virgibacillus profundi]